MARPGWVASTGLDTSSPPTPGRAAQRFWPMFMRARLVVAGVLLGLQVVLWMLGATGQPVLAVLVCALHLAATAVTLTQDPPAEFHQHPLRPWAATIGVDLVVFALLQFLLRGNLNYILLFALPVLMSATLGARHLALGAAAGVTLLLLADASWQALGTTEDPAPRFFQAAITGTAFFLVALLAHQLALRLAREEALSQSSQMAARSQAQVNELVIESMSDGVIVVDIHGVVHTANPAARHMLGDTQGMAPASFLLPAKAHCAGLLELIMATFVRMEPQTAEMQLEASPELRRRLRVRTGLTLEPDPSSPSPQETRLCVVFLEDLHELEARVRTEKLAAMGRMSVAVAHEIRNPLSAIVQANALMQEDLHDPHLQRLAGMVATHTQRLNRIVDDVLNVARVPGRPVAPGTVAPIVLDQAIADILSEWCGHHSCTDRVVWQAGSAGRQVVFEPEHLRRVLVNLLDNASRYASQDARAIQVRTQVEATVGLRLSVWSDGAPLEPSVRRHLFEPFFSSESRSSGLGLYLCRELCDRYRATIGYQRATRDSREGNEFFVSLPESGP